MQFSKLGFDPLSVPVAASGSNAASGTFADRLEQASRRAEPAPARDRQEPTETAPTDASLATAAGEARDRDSDAAEDAAIEAGADAATEAAASDQATTVATSQELPSRESPVRQDDAGEDAGDSLDPLPSRAPLAIPVVAASTSSVVLLPGKAPLSSGIAPLQAAAPTSRATVDRLTGPQLSAEFRTVAVEAKATGYRTLNAAGVAMNEQARDSVFKQILFKLGKEGSEMRVRLDPPELGELDLHMIVDSSNSLRLSIGTERDDLRDLLQGGLDQLKKELQDSGLTVAHAEVHTRQGGDQRSADAFGDAKHPDANGSDADDALQLAASAPKGWYTANGLDFWV